MPMTSKFAYLPELDTGLFDRPKSQERHGYMQTWFAKGDDTPQKYWDLQSAVGDGWFLHAKFTPFSEAKRPEDLLFPPGEIFNAQITWGDPTPWNYLPARKESK